MDLAKALERFNRKERNLLIRDILGSQPEVPPLARNFSERLTSVCSGIKVEDIESAWWATDFHFDWLAGALLTFMKGSEDLTTQDSGPALVMGSPEDLDLIIVPQEPAEQTTSDLILIEAKAYGHFSNEQHKSKVERIRRLHTFYKELEKESPRRIRFHYILCSPEEPSKLHVLPLPWHSDDAPEAQHLHIKLRLSPDYTLSVERGEDNKWNCIRKFQRESPLKQK